MVTIKLKTSAYLNNNNGSSSAAAAATSTPQPPPKLLRPPTPDDEDEDGEDDGEETANGNVNVGGKSASKRGPGRPPKKGKKRGGTPAVKGKDKDKEISTTTATTRLGGGGVGAPTGLKIKLGGQTFGRSTTSSTPPPPPLPPAVPASSVSNTMVEEVGTGGAPVADRDSDQEMVDGSKGPESRSVQDREESEGKPIIAGREDEPEPELEPVEAIAETEAEEVSTPLPIPSSLAVSAPGTPSATDVGTPKGSIAALMGGGVGSSGWGSKVIKGTTYQIREDELVLDDDPKGESKIDKDGNLLGGREWKLPTFTSATRNTPTKRYMLSIDAARAAGFRDSLYFFRRNPLILKLDCSKDEKEKLIADGKLSANLRSRQVTMITARNCFKVLGAAFVKNGRHVLDDYYEDQALAEGKKPGESAYIETYDPEVDTGTLAAPKAMGLGTPSGQPGGGGSGTSTPFGRTGSGFFGGSLGGGGGGGGAGGGGTGMGTPGGGGGNLGGATPAGTYHQYHQPSLLRSSFLPIGASTQTVFGGHGLPPFGRQWDPASKKAKPAAHLNTLNWMGEWAKAVVGFNRGLREIRERGSNVVKLGGGAEDEDEEEVEVEVEEEVAVVEPRASVLPSGSPMPAVSPTVEGGEPDASSSSMQIDLLPPSSTIDPALTSLPPPSAADVVAPTLTITPAAVNGLDSSQLAMEMGGVSSSGMTSNVETPSVEGLLPSPIIDTPAIRETSNQSVPPPSTNGDHLSKPQSRSASPSKAAIAQPPPTRTVITKRIVKRRKLSPPRGFYEPQTCVPHVRFDTQACEATMERVSYYPRLDSVVKMVENEEVAIEDDDDEDDEVEGRTPAEGVEEDEDVEMTGDANGGRSGSKDRERLKTRKKRKLDPVEKRRKLQRMSSAALKANIVSIATELKDSTGTDGVDGSSWNVVYDRSGDVDKGWDDEYDRRRRKPLLSGMWDFTQVAL